MALPSAPRPRPLFPLPVLILKEATLLLRATVDRCSAVSCYVLPTVFTTVRSGLLSMSLNKTPQKVDSAKCGLGHACRTPSAPPPVIKIVVVI